MVSVYHEKTSRQELHNAESGYAKTRERSTINAVFENKLAVLQAVQSECFFTRGTLQAMQAAKNFQFSSSENAKIIEQCFQDSIPCICTIIETTRKEY